MILRWIALLALLWVVPAQAQFSNGSQFGSAGFSNPAPVAAGGGCSQATTWLSGKTTTHSADYTTFICGLVTDGTFSSFERIYILATDNTANALADIVTGASATITGTATFTAFSGYVPNGSTGTLNTGFNYSTGSHYTQNSATIMAWPTGGATADNGCPIGELSAAGGIWLQTFNFGSQAGGFLNGGAAAAQNVVNGTGLVAMDRTSSASISVFKNGSSLGATASTSTTPNNTTAMGFQCNAGGFFAENVGMIAIASSLGATNQASVYARFHVLLHAMNGALYP